MRNTIGLATIACLIAGCSGIGSGGRPAGQPANAPPADASTGATFTSASAGPSPRPSLARLPDVPPPSCRLTKPTPAFAAPPPAPRQPPASYHAAWFGTAALWTMLRRGGEVWAGLPQDADGFGQKTFWWSARWDVNSELQPAISVTGRRLDEQGSFSTSGLGTNAGADFGVAMLIGVTVPTAGCWRLTGTYRGVTLSYVVWVAG